MRLKSCGLIRSFCCCLLLFFFFFNDTATTEIYTLSLHDALPIFAIPTLAVLAVATAAVLLGLTVSAASPSSASAAAQRALAATAAAPSGTMTTTVLHAGVTHTIDAARWNGSDIAFSPGLGPIPQLLLIGGGMYVQTSDGTWLHYANASDVGPKPLGGLEQLAQDSIAGTTPQQILALATGVQQTAQPDGTTLYTGTI